VGIRWGASKKQCRASDQLSHYEALQKRHAEDGIAFAPFVIAERNCAAVLDVKGERVKFFDAPQE
jgi:hypothetical protein